MAFRFPIETAVIFCYLVKRFRYPSEIFDEPSVVTSKSNKRPHFGNFFWSFPVRYCNEFVFIWCNSLWAQFVSQIDYGFLKVTESLGIEFKIGLAKSVKNEAHVFFVFLHIPTKQQNVVQEDEDEREEIFVEDACHKSLEGSRCIAKSKWKSEVLVVYTIGSDERSFWYSTLS